MALVYSTLLSPRTVVAQRCPAHPGAVVAPAILLTSLSYAYIALVPSPHFRTSFTIKIPYNHSNISEGITQPH